MLSRKHLIADVVCQCLDSCLLILRYPFSEESAPFNFQPQSSMEPQVAMGRKKLVTGFCYQIYDGLSVPKADHPTIKVFGDDNIMEEMLGCRFEVSPQSFFQVFSVIYRVLLC